MEIAGVLSRNLPKSGVESIVKDILHDVELIPNPDDFAFEIAMRTGSRASDAYFIAVKLTDSILITNDRVMTDNARKAGAEAYYLIEEFDNVVERLKTYQLS